MIRRPLLLLAAACLPAAARAGTAETTLAVSAMVQDACRVNAVPRLLHVTCPGRTPYSVALDGGTGARRLTGSDGVATYDLHDATAITLTY